MQDYHFVDYYEFTYANYTNSFIKYFFKKIKYNKKTTNQNKTKYKTEQPKLIILTIRSLLNFSI